jgi:hypothetical protein
LNNECGKNAAGAKVMAFLFCESRSSQGHKAISEQTYHARLCGSSKCIVGIG